MTDSREPVAADLAVGEIAAAHALGGMLRLRPYQAPAPSLRPGVVVVLEQGNVRTSARVRSANPHGRGLVLLALEGVDDRTAAEALKGARVLIGRTDLPPLAANEFYYHEIAGFRVETVAGDPLGEVVETFSTGTNDVWVVRDGGREYLVPVIADVVRTIDRAARRIVIEPMTGLLD